MMKRKRPVLRLICFVLVAAVYAKFLWDTEVSLLKLERGLPWMADFIVRMVPPDFGVSSSALRGALQTLEIAVVGTSVAALLALPLGFLSARNIAPASVFYSMRGILNLFRSIDTMVYALFFVAAVGLGPFPGVMAVVVYTTMSLAKLYSEAIEGIDPGPVEAITATGATRLQILRYGVIPQIVSLFISYILYRLETNIRAAAILGFVGAGGIGFYIQTYLRMMNYRAAACVLLVLIVMVMAVDFASSQIRKALV
jgi:phosphonate transport system permease protein